MRAVHRLVAAGAPAGTAREEGTMVASADQDAAGLGLLLEVALEAEVGIALREQFVVYRAVRVMAGGAAFADGFVFEDEGAPLRDVAAGAGIGVGGDGERSAGRGVAFVRIVTVAATHFAIADGMRVGQLEAAFHFEVAGEANLRVAVRVNDGIACAAGLGVETARAVATFATDVLRVGTVGHQACVRGGGEVFVYIGVAFGATFRADEFRAGNIGWHYNHAVDGDAGDENTG